MTVRNRLHKLYYSAAVLIIVSISCNMPGWNDEPTPMTAITRVKVKDTQEEGSPEPPEATAVPPQKPRSSDVLPGNQPCSPLPPPSEPHITVTTESDLRHQAANAASDTTILIAPGVYNLGDSVHIVNSGITLRSVTGSRADVVLDGGGMLTGHTHVILIEADDVTIADLTIRNGGEHGVSINGSDNPKLYNLHIYDTGSQLVKVNPVGDGSHGGILACSRLEYTSTAPDEYTNGISAHDAHDWSVRDNQWYRIRTPGNTPAPTILFWSGSSNTVVERNLLVDCYQGIAFGNSSHGVGDHIGGIVKNNFIYASLPHDSVIEMVHATDWYVAHNTALLLNPNGVTWGMEARFEDTTGVFSFNLTNLDIWVNRDSANGSSVGDMTNLVGDWLRSPSEGDLHLSSPDLPPVDAASPLAYVNLDIDLETRPVIEMPDVGADEFSFFTNYIPVIIR